MEVEQVETQAKRVWTALYITLIGISIFLVFAAIHFFAIEIDEAFNLLSVGQISGGPFSGKAFIAYPVLTSGGLFAAIHYAVLRVGLPIEANRLVSVVFSCLTLVVIYRIVKSQWGDRSVALLGVTAFLTVPGFLFVSGLAWAETVSAFLLIAAAWHWTTHGSTNLVGSVLSGVLFGLAMATRLTALVPALPAIVIWSLIYARAFPVRHGVVAAAIASAVFLLCVAIYFWQFHVGDLYGFLRHSVGATGTSRVKGLGVILDDLLVSESIFPLYGLVAAGCALFLLPQAQTFAAVRPLCVLLWLIAVIGWAAWILIAPFPYLRYLWPALPALWLCGILLLLGWFVTLKPGRPRLLLQAVVLAAWSAQFALSVRQVALGDTTTLVWQGTRQSPIDTFPHPSHETPLQARKEQYKFASIVAGIPKDARIYIDYPDFSFPITFIAHRRANAIRDVRRWQGDSYLMLVPFDKNTIMLSQAAREWIQRNTTLYGRSGDYALYKVNPGASEAPEIFIYPMGGEPHPR
jgi:Dolichyl-phosphate-mannose-protein mannosyltransferase